MRRRKVRDAIIIMVGLSLLVVRFLISARSGEMFLRRGTERASGIILEEAREVYAERINERITDERAGALGVAYLLGMKEGLDKEIQEALKLAGLTHLVVASGTHLGILAEIVKKGFGRASRFSGVFFTSLFILLFGEMVGWTASIARASIVAVLGILGWYFGVELRKMRVLGFSIWATLMWWPGFIFDLGWQLSFLAYFGVLVVGPRLSEALYPRRRKRRETEGLFPEPGAVTETMLTSVGVTICVAPVLIFRFGYFSLASLVGNLVLAPTLPAVMGVTFLAGMPGVVGTGAGWLAKVALEVHIFIIKFLAEKTYFLVKIPAGDARVFLGYLPLLIWLFFGDFTRAQQIQRKAEKIRAKPDKYLRWKILGRGLRTERRGRRQREVYGGGLN